MGGVRDGNGVWNKVLVGVVVGVWGLGFRLGIRLGWG